MHKSSSQWLWATFLILIVLGLTGCEKILVSLPASTSTSTPETTETVTAIPTTPPELPDGPYPPVLFDYEPRSGQEVAVDAVAGAAGPAVIKLFFDQPMDRESVVAAFRVAPTLEGDFDWPDDATLVFRPRALAASTRYRVSLADGVRSVAGLPLSTEFSFAFSTLTPLIVTRLTPAAGSLDARIDTPALIVFNRAVVPLACVGQPVQANSGCPTLPLSFEPPVLGTGAWVETSVYRFDALRGWAAGRAYTATLAADVVSVEGAALGDPVTWSFYTASPAIQASTPADGQSQVSLETDIRVVFNTPMDQEITGSVFSVVGQTGEVVPGAVTWEDNGAVLVFTPVAHLRLGTRYTVQVGARARAATSAPLGNPQSWTFTTVPYPALVATIPQDGATTVDLAEPVRLAFSGALNVATLDRHISITPTVENPYAYFDADANVYYLSWDKQPQTNYCVQAKPGIADVYDNVITTSQTLCFDTGDLPAFVAPASAEGAVTLDASQSSQLSFVVQNRDRVSFTLSEVGEPDFVRARDVEGVVVREWQETFTTPRNTATVVPIVLRRLGGALPAGYYHLAWENPPWGMQSFNFAVVDRHVMLKLAAEEVLVWVTDLRSGEPISRTAVRLVDGDGLLVAAGTTDEDGLAQIPVSLRKDLWTNIAAVVGEPGAVGFGVALSSWMGGAAPSAFGIAFDGSAMAPYVIYVHTDRTIYGPGETVHFRGVVRERADRYLMPSLDMPVQVVLREATGRSVYTTTVAFSDMGSFAGAAVLPESVGVGDYVLEASLPDVSDNRPGAAALTVAAPCKPALTVRIAPESADVLRGDPLRAAITVDDASGVPAAGVRLTWAVYAAGESLQAASSETWQWPEAVSGDPFLVAEGEAVTDAEGHFLLELPAEMPVLAAGQALGPQRWTIEAIVYDAVVQNACKLPVSGQEQVVVHPSRFYLGLQPREWVSRAGMRTEIDLVALDWTQVPVTEQEIAVSLTRREWYRLPGEGATMGYTDTAVSTVRVTTNFEGRAVATLVPPDSGTYIIAADTLDMDEHPVHTEIVLWVSGEGGASWPLEDGKVTPIADAREYRVGDRAKILLPVDFDGPYQLLMTVERDGILAVERQVLDTPNPVVEIPIIEAYVPNVYVSFMLIRGVTETVSAPEVRIGYVTLRAIPSAQTLTVIALPDKETYRSGDTVVLTVRAVDATGREADALVSVALVDKAALSRGGYQSSHRIPSIVEVFYGLHPLQVMTGDGLLVLSSPQNDATLVDTIAFPPLSSARPAAVGTSGAASRARLVDGVLWEGDVRTGASGEARFSFVLPETPATWVAMVYALTTDTKAGETQVEIAAEQPLYLQPVTPGFLVVGDEAEIAAVVYNHTDKPFSGAVQLTADAGVRVDTLMRTFDLPARGRARVVWTLSVPQTSAETVALAFTATGGGYRSTVSTEVPLYRYVMPDVIGVAGVLDKADTRLETVTVSPEAGGASALIVRGVSSPAGALVDTLTYLDQYPYASTDVLIERFVSYVFTYRALQELGVADDALLERLQVSIVQAMERLYTRQNADGSWSWWEGQEERADAVYDDFALHFTAFTTLGLLEAEQAGFDVRHPVRQQALAYIFDHLMPAISGGTYYPHQALGLYVLSRAHVPWPTNASALLYSARESLGVVGRAYLALALGTSDPSDSRLIALLDGLRSEARLSAAGAHWEGSIPVAGGIFGDGGGLHWHTDVVVTGIVLDTLARFAPADPLLAQATRWLMAARRGGLWQTTYESAWVIVGLSAALSTSNDPAVTGESSHYDWAVGLNGVVLTETVAQAAGSNTVVVAPWHLRAGLLPEEGGGASPLSLLSRDRFNVLKITRGSGTGLLYFTAHMELSVPVAQITEESRGLTLRREYCAVEDPTPASGLAVPASCRPLAELSVGEQVAVRLTLTAPQAHTYVRLEVPHPAGFVPVEATGSCALDQGAGWWTVPFEWCEMPDDGREFGRVVFFASAVPAGTHQVTYLLRAVTPGTYGALPAVVSEVYFPEVWGHTGGDVLRVTPLAQD